MLVHICCSVDSHFFLERLQKEFPKEKLVGFFYNPNIHPYAEYRLRLLDVNRSCKKLNIELIEGEYDYEAWLNIAKDLESEPEKGKRCEVCFDKRLFITAQKALEIGETSFTTTLLVSPLKSQEQLKHSAKEFCRDRDLEFVFLDYRSNNGTQEQSRCAKEQKLYRQDYCGCLFALSMQRDSQNKIAKELFSSINNRVLPGSIEQRLELYEKRVELEEDGIEYQIVKEKFLNYRELFSMMKKNRVLIPLYALHYSSLSSSKNRVRAKVEYEIDGVHYLNREQIRMITLEYLNTFLNSSYSTITQLLFNPPALDDEMRLRNNITSSTYSLCAIVVVEKIPTGTVELTLKTACYQDTKELLNIS